jgi:hypothetical protein
MTLTVSGETVTSEMLSSHTAEMRPLVAWILGEPVAADLDAATVVVRQQQDPDVAQVFHRGARFAYRTVEDRRNGIYAVEVLPLGGLRASMQAFNAVAPADPASDAIFAVGAGGTLAPVAVRARGAFDSDDVLTADALAALAAHHNAVHLIFGDRTIATVPANVSNEQASIALPVTLRLSGYVSALASPTLGGHAALGRREPTPAERAAALGLAAAQLATTVQRTHVRSLTAIDLGRGIALVGTVNRRGTESPAVDTHLFFIAESIDGRWRITFSKVQTVVLTDPLLGATGEFLIDALDLGGGTVGVVTRVIGFDAASYEMYARNGATWKELHAGGGVAN